MEDLTSAFGSYVLGSDNLTWNVLFTWSAYGAITLAMVIFPVKKKPDKSQKPTRLINKYANRFDEKKNKNFQQNYHLQHRRICRFVMYYFEECIKCWWSILLH